MAPSTGCATRPRRAVAAGDAVALALPALCLHGLGVSPRHLVPLLRVLERERRVVAPTLPLGVSPEEMAQAALGHLTEPSVVFANSMGCQAAVELALAAPDRIASLVLVGPTADPSAPTMSQQFARLVLDSVREPPRLNWVVATDYLRRGPVPTFRSAQHMLRHPMLERAVRVRVRSIVVRGARDPIVSARWTHVLAGRMGADVVTIAGAAHCAHFTHPDAVAALCG